MGKQPPLPIAIEKDIAWIFQYCDDKPLSAGCVQQALVAWGQEVPKCIASQPADALVSLSVAGKQGKLAGTLPTPDAGLYLWGDATEALISAPTGQQLHTAQHRPAAPTSAQRCHDPMPTHSSLQQQEHMRRAQKGSTALLQPPSSHTQQQQQDAPAAARAMLLAAAAEAYSELQEVMARAADRDTQPAPAAVAPALREAPSGDSLPSDVWKQLRGMPAGRDVAYLEHNPHRGCFSGLFVRIRQDGYLAYRRAAARAAAAAPRQEQTPTGLLSRLSAFFRGTARRSTSASAHERQAPPSEAAYGRFKCQWEGDSQQGVWELHHQQQQQQVQATLVHPNSKQAQQKDAVKAAAATQQRQQRRGPRADRLQVLEADRLLQVAKLNLHREQNAWQRRCWQYGAEAALQMRRAAEQQVQAAEQMCMLAAGGRGRR